MDKNEIIERLGEIGKHAVHIIGEEPFIMSLDDGTAVYEAIDIIQQSQPQSHWIPCSERLPEENRTVIASTKFLVYPEARYTKEYGWEWASESGAENCWVELFEVEAWMPLPEPYMEGAQE